VAHVSRKRRQIGRHTFIEGDWVVHATLYLRDQVLLKVQDKSYHGDNVAVVRALRRLVWGCDLKKLRLAIQQETGSWLSQVQSAAP
jgi:hypothetical protein